MNTKIVTTLALFAILFGSAIGSNIHMLVFHNSNNWWLAVDPMSEAGLTSKMEVLENGGVWTAMNPDQAKGFFTYSTNKDSGFSFPLSFRMTDAVGNQVVANNVMSSITAGKTVDTGVAFAPRAAREVTAPAASCDAPTSAPATEAPTGGHPHHSSGNHGSGSSTSAPTTKPTAAPATQAPTSAPTSGATQAPTSKPTTAPSTGHTSGSTSGSTSAPTSAPTTKPTTKPSTSGSTSGSSSDLCAVTPASQEPLQILIPLYVEPGSAWDEVISAASSGVKIIAIINPNSGPSSSGPDSSYKTYMQKFATAGIDMVGYVHTSYGARSISDVTNDITTYSSKYTGLKGIFIDECSDSASELSYYQQVYSAITSQSGYTNAILNPGTQPDQGYLAVSTNIVVFESPASSFKTNFASWVTCAPSASAKAGYKYKFSAIAYGASQSTMSSTISSMMNAGMGMVYVTDGASGCCTYNTLASYFTAEASAVSALN